MLVSKMDDDIKIKALALLVIVGVATGGIWYGIVYYGTPVEGRVQERGREMFSYYFTIGEDEWYCTKEQYDQICVNSVVRFTPGFYLVQNFEVITDGCT
jgi:hypothetical protein